MVVSLLISFADSWFATAICASLFCVLYEGIGRRYIRAKMKLCDTKTNVDAIISKSGIVTRIIGENTSGLVRIGNEEWHARSEENIYIEEGEAKAIGVNLESGRGVLHEMPGL